MLLNHPETGEAIFDLEPKPLERILRETEQVFYSLMATNKPDLCLEDLEDIYFPGGLTDGSVVEQRVKQPFAEAEWFVAALMGVLLVHHSHAAGQEGRHDHAWSLAASACAWVNYAKGLCSFPQESLFDARAQVMAAAEITEQQKAASRAAREARNAESNGVRKVALQMLVDRCPDDKWDTKTTAARKLVRPVLESEAGPPWTMKRLAEYERKGKSSEFDAERLLYARLVEIFTETKEVRHYFKTKSKSPVADQAADVAIAASGN